MNRLCSLVLLAFVLLLARPAGAEMFGPEYKSCEGRPSISATVECLEARTKGWEQRLNAAYRASLQRSDGGQKKQLRQAQRLWLQYRRANCQFHGGAARQIQAAECLRSMTQDRALELTDTAR